MSGDGVWDYATGAFIPAASNTAGFVIRAVPPEGEPVPASEVLDDDVLEADECGEVHEVRVPFIIRAVPPEEWEHEGDVVYVPLEAVVVDDDLEADEDGDELEPVGEDDGGDRPD